MARKKKILSPTCLELIGPVFKALVELDGSGSNDEICETIIRMLQLQDSAGIDQAHRVGYSIDQSINVNAQKSVPPNFLENMRDLLYKTQGFLKR